MSARPAIRPPVPEHRRTADGSAAARLRVAYVTTVPEFARLILLHDLVRLRDRVEATVICAEGTGIEELRAAGVRVLTIPIRRKLSPLADLHAVWRLWRLLRRERFDVLHSWVPKGGLVGQLAGAMAGVAVRLHSCRGLLYTPEMSSWRRRLFRLTDRLTYALAHRTLFNSGADRDYVVGERLITPDRARYTGSGIDLAHFTRTSALEAEALVLRARLGLSADAPVVLTVGRFVVDKGYRELLEAARAIHTARPDLRFVWVAPTVTGESDTLSDRDIAAAGLAAIVHRVPHQDDVRPYYAMASVLAHATYREGVPRVVMEAAAMGVPIVATDIPGCREVIRAEETGLLVPDHDATALAEAILRTIGDPAATAERASGAERDVRARFSQDAHARRIWDAYDELRSPPSRPVEERERLSAAASRSERAAPDPGGRA
jgi:glycosyltransferase involved in cell wall biosynthesis